MLTVRQALSMKVLSSASLLAGQGGLDKTVEWVHVLDIPEMAAYARRGELVFTTAFGLEGRPEVYDCLIRELAQTNTVGLVINVGRYFDQVPQIMIGQAEEFNFPLIAVPWEVSLVEVTRALSEYIVEERYTLLEQALNVHNTLTQVALGSSNLAQLAQALATLVGSDVVIFDLMFHVLAHAIYGTGRDVSGIDPAWPGTPLALKAELSRQGLLTSVCECLHPVCIRLGGPGGLLLKRIVAPIVAGSERLGYVWAVATDRSVEEADIVAVEHAATVAALILIRERAVYEAKQRQGSALLDQLLNGPAEPPATLLQQAQSLGLNSRQQILMISERQPNLGSLFPLFQFITQYLRAAGRQELTVERGEKLIVLQRCDKTSDGAELAEALWHAARKEGYFLSIGVGESAEGLTHLLESYEQALEALEAGLCFQSEVGGVQAFDDLGVLDWLRQLPPEVRNRNRYWKAMEALADHDVRFRTSYLDTLGSYLDMGCNAKEAANRLYLHRNTLMQRLRRIERILDVDLADPNARLNLHVAYQGWKLRKLSSP